MKVQPTYFSSLTIENVKSFGNKQTLNLKDQEGAISPWTLILGDNGIGKTTLLKLLAWMVPVKFPEDERIKTAKRLRLMSVTDEKLTAEFIQEVSGISEKEWQMISAEKPTGEEEVKRIKPLMDNFENEADFNALIRVGKGVRMDIIAEFTNGVLLNKVPSKEQLISIGISLARKDDDEVDEIEDILNTDHLMTAEVEDFIAPNLFAYGAARHIATENIETLSQNPTYNLLSASGDLYDAEEVLLKLYNDSLEETVKHLTRPGVPAAPDHSSYTEADVNIETKATKYLQKVKEILTKLLPHIEHPDSIIINPSKKKEGHANAKIVEVVTPFGKVGLYDLSLGYQTMLAWVVDLAIRMFWQNPDSDAPLDEPAVVIVDEIDLHLHPKWQRTLKEYLTSNFLATQFICTAHSPFMAQASEDENLSILYEAKINSNTSQVYIENNPTIVKGWHIGQVVTNLFRLSDVSWKIEDNLINKRKVLLNKKNRTSQDEEEIKNLSEQILELPAYGNEEDKKLSEQIRKTLELLKQKGGLANG